MLKCAHAHEEMNGNRIMVWWSGQGAAKVFAHRCNAVIMSRGGGAGALARMALCGDDDLASKMIVQSIQRLHDLPAPDFPVMTAFDRLAPILQGPDTHHKTRARDLLSSKDTQVLLHGDLHHDNLLDFGRAGWLAIDPKGILGPAIIDYMPMLLNPGGDRASTPVAIARMAHRTELLAVQTGYRPTQILAWLDVYAELSALWSEADGQPEAAQRARSIGAHARQLLPAHTARN